MRVLPLFAGLLCAAGALAQSAANTSVPADPFMEHLKARWRAQIRQDLAAKGIVRSVGSPTLPDVKGVVDRLMPFLPEGKRPARGFEGDTRNRYSRMHIETPLDETERTRFLRVWDIFISARRDSNAAEERAAELMCTPAIFKRGALQGAEPGQLCYSSTAGGGGSEIFIRENVVVRIHCRGPVTVPKIPRERGEDPRNALSERTGVPGLCPELASELGLRIDRLIQEELSKP